MTETINNGLDTQVRDLLQREGVDVAALWDTIRQAHDWHTEKDLLIQIFERLPRANTLWRRGAAPAQVQGLTNVVLHLLPSLIQIWADPRIPALVCPYLHDTLECWQGTLWVLLSMVTPQAARVLVDVLDSARGGSGYCLLEAAEVARLERWIDYPGMRGALWAHIASGAPIEFPHPLPDWVVRGSQENVQQLVAAAETERDLSEVRHLARLEDFIAGLRAGGITGESWTWNLTRHDLENMVENSLRDGAPVLDLLADLLRRDNLPGSAWRLVLQEYHARVRSPEIRGVQ